MQEFEPIEERPRFDDVEGGGRSRRPFLIILAAVLVAAAVVVFVLLQRPPAEEPALKLEPPPPTPPPMLPVVVEEEEPEPSLELPPLDASDELVRERAAAVSALPLFRDWLAQEELIRRLVAVVQNIAEGASPGQHLTFLAPREPFRVVEVGERTFVAAESYGRYDPVADVVSSLDLRRGVRVYRLFQPLVDRAHREVGHPGRSFEDTLRQAAESLLEVPVPRDELEVVRKVTTYELVDPALEALTPAQKHLLRMGPRNIRLVQAKLRELLLAL